jgi:hypothetical protein
VPWLKTVVKHEAFAPAPPARSPLPGHRQRRPGDHARPPLTTRLSAWNAYIRAPEAAPAQAARDARAAAQAEGYSLHRRACGGHRRGRRGGRRRRAARGHALATNSAVVLAGGRVVHRQDKINLPTMRRSTKASGSWRGPPSRGFDLHGWRWAILICKDAGGPLIDAVGRAGRGRAVDLHGRQRGGHRRRLGGQPPRMAARECRSGAALRPLRGLRESRGRPRRALLLGGCAVYGPDGSELDALAEEPGVAVVSWTERRSRRSGGDPNQRAR